MAGWGVLSQSDHFQSGTIPFSPQELFRQLDYSLFLEFMETMHGSFVADISLPSPDRARIRRSCTAPSRIIVGPVRSQELPEDLVVFAVIEAGDLEIALGLRRDAFAALSVLLGWYPGFPVGVLIVLVEPHHIAHAPIEVGRLWERIVEIHIPPESHREQHSIDDQHPRPHLTARNAAKSAVGDRCMSRASRR